MQQYGSEMEKIKRALRSHPRGMSITDLSKSLDTNRNSVAKYLDIMLTSGEVEMKKVCTAKLYYLSQRLPLSEMLSLTSDCLIVLDEDQIITFANDAFLQLERTTRREIVGRPLSELTFRLVDGDIASRIGMGSEKAFSKEIEIVSEDDLHILRGKVIGTVLENGKKGTTLLFEDITKKRLCQQRLEKSEELYRAVVEDQTEFIVRYRPDRRIVFANKAYCRAFGLDQGTVAGTKFTPRIPREYIARVLDQFAAITPDRPVVTVENPVIMPDGTEAWHQWTNRGIFDASGVLAEYQSVGRDITATRRIQHAQEELMKEMTILTESATGLIMLGDHENIFRYTAESLSWAAPDAVTVLFSFNDGLYTIEAVRKGREWGDDGVFLYLQASELLGMHCADAALLEFSTPHLEACSLQDYCRLLAGSGARLLSQGLRRMKGVSFSSMGIYSGGEMLGTLLLITEQGHRPKNPPLIETIVHQAAIMIHHRKALESLILAEERYVDLLTRSKSMIGIHAEGKMVYANPALMQFFGYSGDDAWRGLPLEEIIHPAYIDAVLERVEASYETGKAVSPMHEKIYRKDGTPVDVIVYGLPTVYHNKNATQVIVEPVETGAAHIPPSVR